MDSLQDSILPVLHTLVAQSAKASLIACVVSLLCLLPRRWLSSPWRHLLWCAVFARLILPDVPIPNWSWNVSRLLPVAMASSTTAVQPKANVQDLASSQEDLSSDDAFEWDENAASIPSLRAISSTKPTPSSLLSRISWENVPGALWLCGAIVWWFAVGLGWWRFRHVLKGASEARPQTQALLQRCLDDARIRSSVQVKCLDHFAAPAVCGVLRPVILIPKTIEVSLSPAELRLLLLHELGHVKRWDPLVQVAASLLLGLHWWNPVLWFAWSRLRHESEAATDAWVLRKAGADQAPSYGAMLLDLATHTCATGISLLLIPTLLSATSRGKGLRERLLAITGFRMLNRRATLWGLAAITLLALTGFSQNAPAPAPAPENKSAAPSSPVVGGIVVDEQGKPIPSAKIEINFNRPKDTLVKSVLPKGPLKPEFTQSDAEGHWHFDDVPAAIVPETFQDAVGKDTYRLCIAHPDFLLSEFGGTGSELGSAAPFREQTAKLILKRGHVIRGVVRDEKGQGIAGATIERNVRIRHGSDPKTTTDADGNYTLRSARPGDFVVRVSAEGFALQQQRVILTADESLDFTLKLAEILTLKFRNAKGQPITKGYVNFMPVLKPWQDGDRLWFAEPNQDGAIVWKEAPAGSVIAVVHMDGFQRLDQKVNSGEETVLTPKPNPPLPTLTIKVKSAGSGQPLAGCTFETGLVMGMNISNLLWIGDTIHAPLKPGAAEGEYTAQIPKFSSDPMVFRVRHPGYAPALTTMMNPEKGDATLEISLKESSPLTITVLKADGSRATKTGVHVAWGSDPKPWSGDDLLSNPHLLTDFISHRHVEFSSVTGEDGRCVLPACADGASVLVADDSGYATTPYGRLMKDSTLKLKSYRKGEQDLLKIMLRPRTPEGTEGRLHVRLMRKGKPVLEKKGVVMMRCNDQTKYAAYLMPTYVEQGVAISSEKPGTVMFQVALTSPEGNYWFSPAITTEVKAEESNDVTATLEPGIRIAGSLANEVPRPVKDALIYAYVTAGDEEVPSKLLWTDRRPVHDDGSFEFPSLPSGNVRFLVLADGWISPMSRIEGGRNLPWSAGRVPQSRNDVVIPMLRTASCEVTVTDPEGKAVSGATVRISADFSPNGPFPGMMFFNGPRSDMLVPSSSLEEAFAHKLPFIGNRYDQFKALTDAEGHAVIRGLSSLTDLNKVNAVAPGAESRTLHRPSGSVQLEQLKPGETAKVMVRLEK